MKISEKTNLYDLMDAFECKWVDVTFKDGSVKHVFTFDTTFLEDNDTGDAIVYNTTGSIDYGDDLYLKDITDITLSNKQHR